MRTNKLRNLKQYFSRILVVFAILVTAVVFFTPSIGNTFAKRWVSSLVETIEHNSDRQMLLREWQTQAFTRHTL